MPSACCDAQLALRLSNPRHAHCATARGPPARGDIDCRWLQRARVAAGCCVDAVAPRASLTQLLDCAAGTLAVFDSTEMRPIAEAFLRVAVRLYSVASLHHAHCNSRGLLRRIWFDCTALGFERPLTCVHPTAGLHVRGLQGGAAGQFSDQTEGCAGRDGVRHPVQPQFRDRRERWQRAPVRLPPLSHIFVPRLRRSSDQSMAFDLT